MRQARRGTRLLLQWLLSRLTPEQMEMAARSGLLEMAVRAAPSKAAERLARGRPTEKGRGRGGSEQTRRAHEASRRAAPAGLVAADPAPPLIS